MGTGEAKAGAGVAVSGEKQVPGRNDGPKPSMAVLHGAAVSGPPSLMAPAYDLDTDKAMGGPIRTAPM